MALVVFVVFCLAVALTASGALASEAPATERLSALERHTFRLPPDAEVEVWVPNGNVVVDGGASGQAVVEVEKRVDRPHDAGDAADHDLPGALSNVGVRAFIDGPRLRVLADRPGSYGRDVDHSFHVTVLVPADAPIDVRVENGSVSVSDVNAYVHADVTNGRALLDMCRGPVDVDVANGAVRCRYLQSRAAVSLASGQMHITCRDCAALQTYRVGVGSLRAELDEGWNGSLRAETEVGRIRANRGVCSVRGVGSRLAAGPEEAAAGCSLRVGVGAMSVHWA
jgi:hypothetical protein